MKKITSEISALILAGVLCCACQNSQKADENTKSEEQILEEVSLVHAIGKVSPADDWSIVSSPIVARIADILIAEGDSVAAGQLLIRLDSGTSSLTVDAARARLSGLRAESNITRRDLESAQVGAAELKTRYQTSKELFDRDAETRETLEKHSSEWQRQELTVRGLMQKLQMQQAAEREQQLQIQSAEDELSDFTIRAPRRGVVVDLTAKLGQSVNAADELGKIADVADPIVEAEVDELFASDIRVGQEVFLSAVGRNTMVARGVVAYVSPVLSDKSILYETANEGVDRRVRKIKITLEGDHGLPINAKVDCKIKIR